jgi:hypothetical protein
MKRTVLAIFVALCLLGMTGCVAAAVLVPSLADTGHAANEKVALANARNLCLAVNTYNALFPEDIISVDIPLDELKEKLGDLYPAGISDEEMERAQELTEMKDGEAVLRDKG